MSEDCSTCICKEGSCYPSTTIFDKDKTCKSYSPDYEGYIAELEKENAELKSENQKWKDEWQEQVQKATDEGYARTLQTMQLSKAKEIIKKLYAVYYDPCVTESDLKYRDELFAEIKQFLNSEVEK